MSGSEIDIVQCKTIEAVRLYRTVYAAKKSLDRIVHGLRCGELEEKENEAVQRVCVNDVVRNSPIVTLPPFQDRRPRRRALYSSIRMRNLARLTTSMR